MRRAAATVAALIACLSTFVQPASASTHQASVGNYWYEDDAQHDQTKIVVRQGDQITFTVRQQAVPGHTIDVDDLSIHSPNLSLGQTFTTPPLNKVGNFYLYCRPHEQRGHYTRLVVVATAAKTAAPGPKATPRRTSAPARVAATGATASPAPATASPKTTLTPAGVGTAPPGSLDRPVPTNPNSLGALTGHTTKAGVPWTRSLWWLLIASVPIVGAAVLALLRADFTPLPPPKPAPRKRQAAPRKPRKR